MKLSRLAVATASDPDRLQALAESGEAENITA